MDRTDQGSCVYAWGRTETSLGSIPGGLGWLLLSPLRYSAQGPGQRLPLRGQGAVPRNGADAPGLPDFSSDAAFRPERGRFGADRPSFVRWYSCSRPAPGFGRLEAREESSMLLVQHSRAFTRSPLLRTRTRFSWSGAINLFLRRSKEVEMESGACTAARLGARPAYVSTPLVVPASPCMHMAFHPLDESQGLSSQVLCKWRFRRAPARGDRGPAECAGYRFRDGELISPVMCDNM